MDTLASAPSISLDDKYRVDQGQVFVTGVQALVRLPLLRRQIDVAMGLDTAGFISGYRGSPLGIYDKQLWQEKKRLAESHIVFQPGVNEELAATAVWGSQQASLFPGARHDGVFGIWYGKGPGVDRSGDAFKHANFFGTAKNGGVLALAGDDHSCKSSTLPNQSDFAFADAEIPVLSPADIAEIIEFGIKGFDLSRFAGLWVGLKAISDTMDASATVRIDPLRYRSFAPYGVAEPLGGRNARLGRTPPEQEEIHRHFRLPAAMAFARENGFDRLAIDSPAARFGIAASGKAYLHVRQALRDLGLSDAEAAALGLRVYKIGLVWPLEDHSARAFANGLETVLVVEERRDMIEHQLRAALYGLPDGRRPRILGKRDLDDRPLISDVLDIDTAHVTRAILRVLPEAMKTPRMKAAEVRLAEAAQQAAAAPIHLRTPYFCSGCPHSTSTKVPDGSRGMAGIGCHYLATMMNRNTDVYTQMGGEGVLWVGQAPFTDETHVFANLGDGTYFHSGSLAIRQAIAAGANVTYKILYNDAVAMTGGQPVDGQLTVPQIAAQMRAEGVSRIAIVSDDPDRHRRDPVIPAGTSFDHRSRLDAVQQELRSVPGVSVLIYDQVCATEKRRRRKRGLMEQSDRRLLINTSVCEGCGDCSRASNCLSVEPVETEFGRKRRINQSTCNQDATCVDGFCPSFVSVYGGTRKRAQAAHASPNMPDPALPAIPEDGYNMLMTGIGGLGITSLAAILGMAAHLHSRQVRVVDQIGLAQKGGGVYSHLRIGEPQTELFSPRIGAGQADLVLAADIVVAHGKNGLPMMSEARTAVVADPRITPTAEFVRDNAVAFDVPAMTARLAKRARAVHECPAQAIAVALVGDAIFANMVLTGFAWQKGLIPLERGAILRAIELNGASVDANKRAFAFGREAALWPDRIAALLNPAPKLAQTLDDLVGLRAAELAAYQDVAYAARYLAFIDRVREREIAVAPQSEALTRAVAQNLFRLMAIKDEYEVARLYTDGAFAEQISAEFDGDVKLKFHLAPPIFGRRDPDTGQLKKMTFGPWMLPVLRVLAKGKRLRGTWLDPFARLAERKVERALLADYEARIERLLPSLTRANLSLAAAYAAVPDIIRGFGHVKEANIAKATARYAELEAAFATDGQTRKAAE
ncbi:Pyruvate/ketoisovalerate oxidoreductase, catalytic domain protein [Rhodomicrobium vannielii ATCC 17100]|uniref:Pyruvate/ketoisovalerate oxidoreductase, catalytic domain protein n=1 Tax=Rhodomicrobium vannielii (strain ATCC 17100 / DSM 162 / LMG 4299 / NCIMB 10020 / ATH 3.1.1) TaxID=648757 RepID=E3I022_RHOVT|nr:indolepyruvate ferredoxin oxidoreductase family protein [Rhodomicrobium vannielii]ADP69973.1 Pyruvate/ketoisovalerate oxidoreductase, catalytic domain protein [Rhodomicrobium vannielii ATCC 17100]